MKVDVVIVGGGAAGLFCASRAAKRGRRTLVIESGPRVGRKIMISGGGRCNFTNLGTSPENFVSENPHFTRSALARFTPDDLLALVRKHKVEYYEKKLGQLFCRESAAPFVRMLLAECERTGVEIRTATRVANITKTAEGFAIDIGRERIEAARLVIATGGLSFAKLGASPFGYEVAEQFAVARTRLRPSLVALVAAKKPPSSLAGTSLDVIAASGKASFREKMLFTHRGASGPAILQISNYWDAETPVAIDLLPDANLAELLARAAADPAIRERKLVNLLAGTIPRRVAEFVAGSHDRRRKIWDKAVRELSKVEIDAAAEQVHRSQWTFTGTEGYDRAEVTLGGVSTLELSSQTMESRDVPGLYFIGEVVDVTGWLGGYNFQWAWASAAAAAEAV